MSPSYIPEDLKRKIREQACDRCGYCRSLQKYILGALEIDQVIPKAKDSFIQDTRSFILHRNTSISTLNRFYSPPSPSSSSRDGCFINAILSVLRRNALVADEDCSFGSVDGSIVNAIGSSH